MPQFFFFVAIKKVLKLNPLQFDKRAIRELKHILIFFIQQNYVKKLYNKWRNSPISE